MRSPVTRGHSCASDPRRAVAELHDAVATAELAFMMFFCSSEYDLDAVDAELRARFAGIPVVGCTTAGEIGPLGCRQHSFVGVGFAAPEFSAMASGMHHLQSFEPSCAAMLAGELLSGVVTEDGARTGSFAVLLVDGTSVREESVAHALQQSLGPIPLVGGSAGDDLHFDETFVYFDGSFHRDAAAVALVTSDAPFEILRVEHFVPTDERLIVTAADAEKRVVYELDGMPAAERYASLIGTRVEDLSPVRFAETPVVVTIGGTNYVRSIQKANADGSLTFFSAIDEGIVLRSAIAVDLVSNLENAFAGLGSRIGDPEVTVVFDCILRRLEMERAGVLDPVERILKENRAVGFNTYGEQYCGVHVNQTMTGIAIGCPRHE